MFLCVVKTGCQRVMLRHARESRRRMLCTRGSKLLAVKYDVDALRSYQSRSRREKAKAIQALTEAW